ncbi:MAG: BT_3928 family protein [Tenuifilaceae bacterium]
MKYLIIICRYLLALLFIFSGFVKGVDPLGSAYKFTDYFRAFNLDFLEFTTVTFSFIICALELLIGLLLLFGIKMRLAVWGAFLFMVVFTPLTFILAIFNPVQDCGCFGDALILTNWETFSKNIIFLAASLVLLIGRSMLPRRFVKIKEFAIFLILIFVSFLPPIIGYTQLPLIDFRPYKIGVNIPDAMKIPEGAPVDVYKTILYYEKDGVVKEFNENNIPWQDSTWKFVDSKSEIISKGFTPAIEAFTITTTFGNDITDSILTKNDYYFLVIAHRIDKSNSNSVFKLNEIYFKAKEQGYGFACVTASTQGDIDSFVSKSGAEFPFLNADETMLKTMIRSNPGLILLNKGTVIGQWHHNNLPKAEYFTGNILAKQLETIKSESNSRLIWFAIALLAFFLVLSYSVKQKN